MFYIHETPLAFYANITVIIFSLLVFLLLLIDAFQKTGKSRTTRFLGFISALFVFLTYTTIAASVYLLPAAAPIGALLVYYQIGYSFIGLHSFFLIFYTIIGTFPDFFEKRKWTILLPVIGTLSYLILVWVYVTPLTAMIVSDGVLNIVYMPLGLAIYAMVLAIFYFLLIPVYCGYTLATKAKGIAGTPTAKWIWLMTISALLWFIALISQAWMGFAPYFVYLIFFSGLVWFLFFISYLGFWRSYKPSSS